MCSSLQSITIPSSITSISPYCFNGCASLKEVIIPEGITKIGEGAFYGCTGLGNITIAESVSQIDSQAFRGCSGLSFVNIPLGVNVIGAGAFMECSGLLIGEGIKIETRDFFYWEILNSGLRPDMNNPQNNAKMFVTDYWSSEWEKHQF